MDRLKELRKDKKLSQSQFGKIMGMSKMAISHWESGNSEPSISQLVFIADYFDVSIDYLVGRKDF